MSIDSTTKGKKGEVSLQDEKSKYDSYFELLKTYGKFREHFEGYDHLKAVTYCNSPEKILELFEDLDYEEVEVFVGDNRSSDYRKELIGKPKIADKLEELKKEGRLRIYTIEEQGMSDVHSKHYILRDGEDNVKLISGSPNLTKTGWGGHQKNQIFVIECKDGHDHHEKLLDIHNHQVEEYGSLFLEDLTQLIEKKDDEKEREEVIEEWLEGKNSTKDDTKELFQKITYEATDISDEEKINISLVGYDDRAIKKLKERTKNYGGSLSGNNFEIPKQGVDRLYRERYDIPVMKVKSGDLRLMNSGKAKSMVSELPESSEEINRHLEKFEKYFDLVGKYGKTSDLQAVKSHMFEAILYFFWGPFAHLQARYYKNNGIENITKHIPFLYIYGESNAGKGTLAKYGLRLISKNTVVDYMEGDELCKRSIRTIKKINTCFPLVIDDIQKSDPPKSLLTNYWDQRNFEDALPPIVFTSNDGKPKKWFKNRSKILHFDVMFEEEKERERQLSQVLDQENPLFEWFSYLFLNTDHGELFCDREGKLENDVLAPSRKIFKTIYREAGRELPDYFPETPAEELYDKGKELWKRAYEDGSISGIEEDDEHILIHLDVDNYEIFKFQNNLPKNIRAEKRGNKIEIRNPDDFMEWFGSENVRKNRLFDKIKNIMR